MNHSGSMPHLFRVYLNCSGWIQDPLTIQFQGQSRLFRSSILPSTI